MKNLLIVLILILSQLSFAYSDGSIVKYAEFHKSILRLLRLSPSKEIIYKRFEGVSYTLGYKNNCEVQLKSSATLTTFDIIFPYSEHLQVTVEFSTFNEISKQINKQQTKFFSHQVSCNGDQYDTYRECWEYDHHELIFDNDQYDFDNLLVVTLKGQSCIIDI